jgi:hypothetical protein
MEYRECRTCTEYLPIDDFYYSISEKTGKIHLSTPDCKECAKHKEREERREAKDAAGIGSEKVFNTPNTYKDKHQKKQTFDVMLAMGWKFNEEKGIWYDDIKKTSDGMFIGVWSPSPKKIRPKLVFTESNPPKIKFKYERKGDLLSEETVNKILFDYYVKNMKLLDIAHKYSTHKSTVSTYTKYLYNQEMDRRRNPDIIPTNKTSITRKKHFKKERPTTIPTVILSRDKIMFTPEVVKQIQYDYFMGDLKFYDVVEKYVDYDAKTVAYIIRKTMNLIKLTKDANEN